MPATCETCRWWDKEAEGHTYATCRRMPPSPSWGVSINARGNYQNPDVSVQSLANGQFPNVHKDEWCGEHQPKEPDHG